VVGEEALFRFILEVAAEFVVPCLCAVSIWYSILLYKLIFGDR
jgi:hypothetical protein